MAGVDPLRCCILLLTLTIQLRHKRNMPEDEGTPGKKRGKGKQGRSWNKEDDKKLERLLKNGDIDIRENLGGDEYKTYLHEKSVEYFPEVSKDKKNNIVRMQRKIRVYNLNKSLTGIRRANASTEERTEEEEEGKSEFL